MLGHLRRAGGMIGLAESLLLVGRKPVVILPLVRGHIGLEERDLAVAIGECLGNRSLHFLVLGAVIDIQAQRLGHLLKHCGVLLVVTCRALGGEGDVFLQVFPELGEDVRKRGRCGTSKNARLWAVRAGHSVRNICRFNATVSFPYPSGRDSPLQTSRTGRR